MMMSKYSPSPFIPFTFRIISHHPAFLLRLSLNAGGPEIPLLLLTCHFIMLDDMSEFTALRRPCLRPRGWRGKGYPPSLPSTSP
jgi:hypothetical protein